MKTKLILTSIFLLVFVGAYSQNVGDSDLIEAFAHEWMETSTNRERIITFNVNGTFETRSMYDDFKITGRYWLYQLPETASEAYEELVSTDLIKGTLQQENPIKKYMDKGVHPDTKDYHGFIIEEVYSNGVVHWSAGVWKIKGNRIEIIGGASFVGSVNNYYFKGKKLDEW